MKDDPGHKELAHVLGSGVFRSDIWNRKGDVVGRYS